MNGDPIDPVTFKRAAKELFESLARHAGIDLMEFYRSEDDSGPADRQTQWRETDERLGELRGEAEFRLQGLMIVEELRSWTANNGDWRRVSQEDLKLWLLSAADERPVLYLDRNELKYLRPDRYMLDRSALTPPPKRGRPAGSGTYAEDDAPLLIEMQGLLKSGEALSPHAASLIVAERARGGGSTESKAKRLRDAFLSIHRDET